MFRRGDLCESDERRDPTVGLIPRVGNRLSQIDPDRLVGIAKRILVCPSARIAHVAGLDAVFGRAIGLQAALSPPRTFSDATVALGRTLIVCDAANDDAYCDFLEARCFPGVRFVFGVPLRDGGGAAFGALILFDYKQRQQPDPRDVKDIEQIAEVIALALQARSGEPADRTH